MSINNLETLRDQLRPIPKKTNILISRNQNHSKMPMYTTTYRKEQEFCDQVAKEFIKLPKANIPLEQGVF